MISNLLLAGTSQERELFNTLTKEAFFAQDSEEARQFNEATKTRYDSILKQQSDPEFLKSNSLPKVCKGMSYEPPKIATNSSGARHENTFVVTNNTHSK